MSDSEDNMEINLVSDSDDNGQPPAKRKPAAKLKAPPAKATPKRSSAAAAKAARPKMEFTPHSWASPGRLLRHATWQHYDA